MLLPDVDLEAGRHPRVGTLTNRRKREWINSHLDVTPGNNECGVSSGIVANEAMEFIVLNIRAGRLCLDVCIRSHRLLLL